MKHPKVDDTALVTQKAFDALWKDKGWRLVKQDEPKTTKPSDEKKE